MNPARKAALWQTISNLLREYELAQVEATKAQIRETWDGLRQRLTVVALEDAAANDGNEP